VATSKRDWCRKKQALYKTTSRRETTYHTVGSDVQIGHLAWWQGILSLPKGGAGNAIGTSPNADSQYEIAHLRNSLLTSVTPSIPAGLCVQTVSARWNTK
jgi:hypothetical protein